MKVMIRLLFVGLFALCPFMAQTQSAEASIRWLESMLDYRYYNEEQGKWWINRLEYDREQDQIRIQNTSTTHPKNIASKQWIHRRVALYHLDPRTITKEQIPENRGRIIRGAMVKVRTVGDDRLIEKTIDGDRGSSETFLQFAIPEAMLEVDTTLADSLSYHLSAVIHSSGAIRKSRSPTDNLTSVMRVFHGTFRCPGFVRTFSSVYDHVVQFEDKDGEVLVQKGFFGYNAEEQGFYQWVVAADGSMTTDYKLAEGPQLLLESETGGTAIAFENLLTFRIYEYSMELECQRLGYD